MSTGGNMAEKTKKVQIGEHVTWKAMGDDKSIILDLDSGSYYTLNETATAAWKIIDQGGDIDQVVNTLSGKFLAEDAKISDDVMTFTKALSHKGLATLIDKESSEETAITPEILGNPLEYTKPAIEQHEAVQQVTAGTGSSSSSGGGHYWYPN